MPRVTVSEAVPEYLAHLRARNLSPNTIRSRRISLLELSRRCGTLAVSSLAPRHLDAIFTRRPDWSPGTRNNRLSHYKNFFSWCRARGYMNRDSDPAYGWTFAKVPNRDRLKIPVSEWSRLFENCGSPRDEMVIALGLYLFLRSSEVKEIRLKDIHLDRFEIEIHRTKTKDFDVMPITSELAGHLRTYLTFYSEQIGSDREFYLIPSSRVRAGSNGFIRGSIQYDPTKPFAEPHDLVKKILRASGYPDKGEGNHTLRRSGARAYFDALVASGYDGALKRVQSMLGHSKGEMTERYLGLNPERHSRNVDLRGRPMFPHLQDAKIVPIRKGL